MASTKNILKRLHSLNLILILNIWTFCWDSCDCFVETEDGAVTVLEDVFADRVRVF